MLSNIKYFKSNLFLQDAKENARRNGYDPSKLELSDDNIHKLIYHSPEGLKRFGRLNYGDYLYYKRFNPQIAEQKRHVFRSSHGAMSKIYNLNKYSPNELSINILW